MENALEKIAGDISNYMGSLITKRVFVAIVGKDAEVYYRDEEFDIYIDLIYSFMKTSFPMLKIGDHALPISSLPLIFFKISDNFTIILYSRSEGIKPGQLLAFKAKMNKYGEALEEVVGSIIPIVEAPKVEKVAEIAVEPEDEVEVEGEIRVVPYLVRKIKKKNKFELSETIVLNLIDNNNSIEDICNKSDLPREEVDDIIKKYRQKDWLRIRIVEPEVRIRKSLKIYPKLTEAVSLTMGISDTDRLVLEHCSGNESIEDIVQSTSLSRTKVIEVLDKYEDKKWLDFSSDGKLDYLPKNLKKLTPMGVQLGLMSRKEYKIREFCTGDVTARSIAKTINMDYEKLLDILQDMEKKKDIKIKVKKA